MVQHSARYGVDNGGRLDNGGDKDAYGCVRGEGSQRAGPVKAGL